MPFERGMYDTKPFQMPREEWVINFLKNQIRTSQEAKIMGQPLL